MPFESQAQRRFMYAKHPKLAKEFEAATPKGAKLPEHVKKAELEIQSCFTKIAGIIFGKSQANTVHPH